MCKYEKPLLLGWSLSLHLKYFGLWVNVPSRLHGAMLGTNVLAWSIQNPERHSYVTHDSKHAKGYFLCSFKNVSSNSNR